MRASLTWLADALRDLAEPRTMVQLACASVMLASAALIVACLQVLR